MVLTEVIYIPDYPLDIYIEFMDFLCHTRERRERGIVEVNIHGETTMEVNQNDPK